MYLIHKIPTMPPQNETASKDVQISERPSSVQNPLIAKNNPFK